MGAPTSSEIYDRAEQDGQRRLDLLPRERASKALTAGIILVFGVAAAALIRGLVAPVLGGGLAQLAAALCFATVFAFLVISRSELIIENFFDTAAAAVHRRHYLWQLPRLWGTVLVLNILGGVAVAAAVFAFDGVLSAGTRMALLRAAEEVATKSVAATFAGAVAGGVLLTLLSYLLHAADSKGSRMVLAYLAGFFLALGPFLHIVISGIHMLFGVWLGGHLTYVDVAMNIVVAAAGNLTGALLLIGLTLGVRERHKR